MQGQDAADYAGILAGLAVADGWAARIAAEATWPGPHPRSPMHADDQRLDPYHISHAAWSSLTHAVDHLACMQALMRDAAVLHMYAPYTLIRAALENACTAVWLLEPAARTERITRRLRLAAADIKHGEDARAITGQQGPKSKAERLEQVAEIATRCGIEPGQASRRPGYEEIVGETGDDEKLAVLIWKTCSGIAHGDLWATVAAAALLRLPGGSSKVGTFAVSANVRLLMHMTSIAVLMTGRGWQLYDQRSLSPWAGQAGAAVS